MKNYNNILLCILASALLFASACRKMDDYLKYTGGKEISYTGRVDSVRILSGNGRVIVSGLLMSDPKISKLKIYWNNRTDSLTQDVSRSAGVDTVWIPITLPEGSYNFEIYTFDKEGNRSVAVNKSGASYGSIFQAGITNRPIKFAEKSGNDVKVEMYGGDSNSPFTRIIYTGTDDKTHVVDATGESASVLLKDYKSQTKFKYQSYFLPDTAAIDTFKANELTIVPQEDLTPIYLKNPGRYIVRGDNGTGKWGTAKDWLFNSAATNQDGGKGGGWSTDDGGVIHFETKDWGGDGVNNGKVWQTFTLPAGTYNALFETGNYGGDSYSVKEVIAEGSTLPDMNNLGSPLAIFHGDRNNLGGTHTLTFTLDKPTTISMGWVVNTGQYVYLQFRSVKLIIPGSGY